MIEKYTKLIEDNHKLVYYIVNKHFKNLSKETKEDLISEGFLSIIRKADLYNSSRGAFSTFIVKCIYLDLIKYLEKCENKHYKVSLIDDIILDNLTFSELLITEQKEFKYIDLYIYLNKLSKKKKDMITEIYFKGKTRREVAIKYKISAQRVGYIIKSTLNELRENLKCVEQNGEDILYN